MNGSSKGDILLCDECGERMMLNGPLSVWSLATTSFGCKCGERLTLADSLDHRGFGEAGGTTKASLPASLPPP
jgi:hypothetical protein